MPSTASFYSIINNVWDSSNHALRMSLNYVHPHSSGSGGLLDWDVVWGDAVHSHGTDTEGGQLDWDVCWIDPVHSHQSSAEGGVLDHGLSMSSASLADDDHPQYVQESILTGAGDIPCAAGSATWSRLAIGSPNQALVVNAAGTGYSFAANVAHINSGSYTGLSTGSNTGIAHGLGVTPQWVEIWTLTADIHWYITNGTGLLFGDIQGASNNEIYSLTPPDATNFYVGTATNYTNSANGSGRQMRWTAFG